MDALGNPLGFALTGGQAHDLAGADALLPDMEAEALIADRAFDADARVSTHGDTAWIASGWQTEATGPDGRPFARPGRGTFVLERRGGTWLAVHSHFSLLPSQSETAHGRPAAKSR